VSPKAARMSLWSVKNLRIPAVDLLPDGAGRLAVGVVPLPEHHAVFRPRRSAGAFVGCPPEKGAASGR
jgi:hypothetical protein